MQLTPQQFIAKWQESELSERSAAQEHFIDLCRLLGEPTPADVDQTGQDYCFEKGARKDSGAHGWADVWRRSRFAWEYKGPHKDLDSAFDQLRQYALALENPPLLIVSDMKRFRLHTNWTNSVSEIHEFGITDLDDSACRNKLKWAMSDPERLKPERTIQALTEQAAEAFASLAQAMRARGYEPHAVAHFINRLVFCMFAEDVGLLPDQLFTRMLNSALKQPKEFAGMAKELFNAMANGGRFGIEIVDHFNGKLFDDDTALSLRRSEIETVLEAAQLDWSEVDPSILGTLFERGLDPCKRSQLGAHYTDRDKIMRIVEPVIIAPLRSEWAAVRTHIMDLLDRAEEAKSRSAQTRRREEAAQILRDHLARLRTFTILDPACGSGNFLYLGLHALKQIEHTVQLEAEAMGLPREFPTVGPANVKGIEINPYAAELARVSVWIGEIQWMRRNGFGGARDPILDALDTIECRDAILNDDGSEPEWPQADIVIGNPPFLGGDLMRGELGNDYCNALRHLYRRRIDGKADLVSYWFDKAQRLVSSGKVLRAGLVSTNSIRDGRNRGVLDRIVEDCEIYDAWEDEPWESDGADVRVSIVCFCTNSPNFPKRLNGDSVERINADLSAHSADLTTAVVLSENRGVAFKGGGKVGPLNVEGKLAREWLCLPTNPNGRHNADVLKPWLNARSLTGRPADEWIVDFGNSMSEHEAALFESPFQYVLEEVKPVRLQNNNRNWRENWWQPGETRPKMWAALADMTRYIATPRHSKHRLFVWCDIHVYPDSALVIFARDDDTTFGILHSRFHEAWSLRLGTSLEDRPRYTHTTTFQTYPFPRGLTPNTPAADYARDPRANAIADAAKNLVELRDNWLSPPELVEWVDEVVPGYPKRPVLLNDEAEKQLKSRTLTQLYNHPRPQWLIDAHTALDRAVAAAYGWPPDISTGEALGYLLHMNLQQSTS